MSHHLPALIFIILLLLFCTSYARADASDMVFRDANGDSLTIMAKTKCELGGWFEKWKRAVWFWRGKNYESCWRLSKTQDGWTVYTIDENGDVGSISANLFRPVETT